MKHFPLVWAALWRKPLEMALLLAAITCAFTLFGLMIGLRETTRQVIAQSRADRVIVNPRYDAPFGLPSALGEQIARIDGVKALGLRTSLAGYRGDPTESVWVDGVDERMREVTFDAVLTPAQWDRLFATRTGVFVSRRIAERLNLHSGDRLVVTAPRVARADGGTTWTFDVLGVVANESLRNGNLVLANYHTLDEQRPESQRGRAFIDVAVASPDIGDRVALAIDRHFANSGTSTASITFRAAQENMDADGLGIAVMTWGIGLAGLFMILLLVGNAIAQSVRERIPELAVLSAVGYPPRVISGLIVAEALVPCLVGAVAGLGLAKAVALLPRSAMPEALRDQIPTFTATVWITVLGIAVALALLGALIPTWQLRRLRVPAALVAA